MREHYYALSRNDAWAAMSQTCEDDPNPPLVIFESPEVAELYRHVIAGDDWEVLEIDSDELEHHADDAGNRVLLCTKVGDKTIDKYELTVEDLDRRELEVN
jgi:hypothetical protein